MKDDPGRGRSILTRSPFPTGRWVGPTADNFDGQRFRNQGETLHASLSSALKWVANRDRGPWREVEAEPGPPPPPHVESGMRVTFVNHATLLLQIDGLNLLTDPVWGERTSPVSWAGPRRHRPPGVRFEDLPPIDAVLLSHDHYDHLCAPTMTRLAREHGPVVLAGLGNGALLSHLGVREPVELDWWDAHVMGDTRITFVPAQHFSGRGVSDRDTSLWGGFVVESSSGRAYFAGDTGMGVHFRQIRERFGPMDLALLPIGAFRPIWFMSRVHVSPAEAVEAARILEARTSVGMHYGTFSLADDGMDEPVEELEKALAALGDEAPTFWTLDEGEGRDVPLGDAVARAAE